MRSPMRMLMAWAVALMACAPPEDGEPPLVGHAQQGRAVLRGEWGLVFRPVQLSVVGPSGEALDRQAVGLSLYAELDDGSGWPARVQLYEDSRNSNSSIYQVPVGAPVRAVAYHPSHPVEEVVIPAEPGEELQHAVLQLRPRVPERTLRLELDCPWLGVSAYGRSAEVRTGESGVPFEWLAADGSGEAVRLPAGRYDLVIEGTQVAECFGGLYKVPDFTDHSLVVDLRERSQELRVRPRRGGFLRLQLTSPLGGLDEPPPRYRLNGEPWNRRTLEMLQRADWVRIKLVDVDTKQEVATDWFWPEIDAVTEPQAGLLLGSSALAANRIRRGTYELFLQGRGIEPLVQRIEIRGVDDPPIVLAPRAR